MTFKNADAVRGARSIASHAIRRSADQNEKTARMMEQHLELNQKTAECVVSFRAEARELRKIAAELESQSQH